MNIFNKEVLIHKLLVPIIVVLVIILSPFIMLMWVGSLLRGLWLNIYFRAKWHKKGKYILFVYSESPNWQQYIKDNIAPIIEEKAIFLNWSKRLEWEKKKPLEAKVLEYWGGQSEFNPLAIVFLPKGRVKVIRFHQAFKDYKHGKCTLLKSKEDELYETL